VPTDQSERVRALTDHALAATEPAVALRALSALRDELVAFERLQVARALDGGETFAGIAKALGISRQAAHRRYRDLVGVSMPHPEPAHGTRPGRIIVTSEARTAVNLAREEAASLGTGIVGSEHLLLGILRSRDRRATNALRCAGVTLEAARECAQPAMVDGSPPEATPPPPVHRGPGGISAYARAVFEQSLREAVARGDGYIGVDHLLLATIADPHGGASRTLRGLGADLDEVRGQLIAAP
jgi:hypothetical protein